MSMFLYSKRYQSDISPRNHCQGALERHLGYHVWSFTVDISATDTRTRCTF
ncbi:RIMS-binding protein 3 [Frankliniella fusca]|uniref:RIMS-binding protein 3 n=1 Tax=Frankliniella fusca TaxID=407009 RepID=A0AAE1L5D3_9NEOP|nr:RIMS-binding protein 3 [Frankliniella fusca]